jgi:hypothetical protein
MAQYQIITLVDITRSNASRTETDKLKLAQQANFNSLLQAIGLRSNVEWNIDPKQTSGALPYDISGKATHWIWDFYCEREDVFLKEDDPVGLLLDDLHGVPIIDQLNNSVDITPACFICRNGKQNTWLYKISD